MSALKIKSNKPKLSQTPQTRLAAQALRKAQRIAIKEDIRYGLKPVLMAKSATKTRIK